MNFEKNKTAIISIVVLLVVCAGTFVGVRSMNNNFTATTAQTATNQAADTTKQAVTSVADSTTSPVSTELTSNKLVPTTLPMATTNASEFASQATSNLAEVITTYPMVPDISTTNKEESTTSVTSEKTTTEDATSQATEATTESATKSTTAVAQNTTIPNSALEKSGLAGYLYNSDGNYYYTSTDPWQRALGYNEFFDLGAGFVSIYMDTIRFKFEYANKDWIIQFWKGQYGFLFVGHEIGVYTKPKDREVEHYDAATENDENALYMSMPGYRKGEEIYSREYAKYWWCTGFVPGKLDNFSDRSELSLKCRITMKDEDMLKAFTASLDKNGLVKEKDYTVSDLDVFITW